MIKPVEEYSPEVCAFSVNWNGEDEEPAFQFGRRATR